MTAAPLPALYLARTPRLVRRVAAVLFAALFATPALLLFVPWQQTVRGKGQVVAFTPLDRRQTVEAPVDGRLVAWAVQESTEVAAGDPLVEISDNDPRYVARLQDRLVALEAKREAAVAKAASYTDQIEALATSQRLTEAAARERVRMAGERVEAAERALEADEAALETARLNLERRRALVEEGLASRRDVELAVLAHETARAEVERSRAALRAARSERVALEVERERVTADVAAKVASARAAREAAAADLASARQSILEVETDLARQETRRVLSPVAGTVLRLEGGRSGEQVKKGDPLVVIVPETDALAVELWVDGNDMPLVQPGSDVRLQFEGWPAVQFTGWPSVAVGTFGGEVRFVDAAADGSGRFRVVVVPDPAEPEWPSRRYLRQGVQAKGWFLLQRVRLGYELWRQLNGFPPAIAPSEPKPPGAK